MNLPPLPSVDHVVAQLNEQGIALPRGSVRVDAYGDSEALSEELLELIRVGRKRAGTGLLWAYEAESTVIPRKETLRSWWIIEMHQRSSRGSHP